ncbi:MAG: hypothetical protein Q9174_002178, partial [Haloplaca sp. 1 TL-2023]
EENGEEEEREGEEDEDDEGGGFLPDRDAGEALPTATGTIEDEEGSDSDSDGYMPSDQDEEAAPTRRRRQRITRRWSPSIEAQEPYVHDEDEGGGFIRDDDDGEGGGGFVPDEENDQGGGFIPDIDHEEDEGSRVFVPTSHEPGNTPQTAKPSHEQGDVITDARDNSAAVAAAVREQKEKPFLSSSPPPPPPSLQQQAASATPASSKTEESHPSLDKGQNGAESMLNLTDAEIAEATMLQQMYERNKSPDTDAEASTTHDQPEMDEPEQQVELAQQVTEEASEDYDDDDDEDDHEDQGSLLSEDPADEDAEPEWLA